MDPDKADSAEDPLGKWKAIRAEYSHGEDGNAQVRLDVRRIEVSLTVEPLEMLLKILNHIASGESASTCKPDHDQDAHTFQPSGRNTWLRKESPPAEGCNESRDSGVTKWMQHIRSSVFARKSDTIPASAMDIVVRVGPLDVAMIPKGRSKKKGEHALVLQMQQFEYSSHADEHLLPRARLHAKGQRLQTASCGNAL